MWVMRKLPNDEADAVLFGAGAWPSDLDRYVTLLRAGLNAGHKVKWIEPLDERTRQMLRETLSGIRDEEPDISLEEAAALLSMTTDQVGLLLKGG